ncbi:uncharacterized protein LOC101461513 isoform X1 [Ceratitis capitata]|nr:uncharacterized protein LOC101461513 isoform X1 [Ceratitis capitata]XP_020715295.1 uncharacterized protein LOC101461513 isoform X1 [Ceratitis capitata]
MTDKNAGHNGTQWTKATVTGAAAIAAQPHKSHNSSLLTGPQHLLHQPQRLYDPAAIMPAHSSIFGAGVGAALGHPAHPDGIAPFAGARFHPPPLPIQQSTIDAANITHTIVHQHSQHSTQITQHQMSPSHTPTTMLTAPAAASPSVPVQSGFVPPPLLPASATSVLTPNPFAVTPQLEHLAPHLNLQQQLELNKIMTVMSSSNTVGSVGGNNSSSSSHQQPTRHMVIDVPMSSTGSNSNNSCSSINATGPVSGAISSTITENVLNAISAAPNSSVSASVPAVHGRLTGIGVRIPDDDRLRRIQEAVGAGISDLAKLQIQQIVDRVSVLKPMEKLLLYLRLPGEASETDPLRHPQNPLGTRSEINHTINWVRSHLEHDPKVSIPKQDVYNDYIAYCERLDIKPLSTADFGKVMKQVFPGIRPRRLGTRGHSRYCYAAMRKTTKLDAPQLPLLDTAAANESSLVDGRSDDGPPGEVAPSNPDTETWQIIRNWAESMLNVKVDNAQELASHIKSVNVGKEISATARSGGSTTHKKYTPREPKEKRLMVFKDMGPLKKRRKKKRKGSSSSESSCSHISPKASVQPQTPLSATDAQSADVKPVLTGELIQIKQEVVDSPTMQRVQHLPAAISQLPQITTANDTFLLQQQQQQRQQQQQQQQMLPMNLVTEQRTVLARAPPAPSAFGVVHAQVQIPQQRHPTRNILTGVMPSTSAVKNLTPKIIELGTAESAAMATTAVQEPATVIKEEEFLDEYNTNIFCKKVRKAQQTKGFWANSPTCVPSNIAVPSITTTAAPSDVDSSSVTLSAVATSVIATSAMSSTHASAINPGTESTPSDLMGPPAQIGSHTSVSPSSSLLTADSSSNATAHPPIAASPKVLSRNMQQMRAKRQQIMAALAAEAHANASNISDADAGDLPSNLGLPRERVISICNMDKHELDDYFVDGEVEEEQEDQDTELLQYFQTRDAEEKSNSSDAVKSNKYPTAATQATPTIATQATKTLTSTSARAFAKTTSLTAKSSPQAINKQLSVQLNVADNYSYSPQLSNSGVTNAGANKKQTATSVFLHKASPTTTTTTTMAVGSASASLTFMSQKHQQELQLHNQLVRKESSQQTNTVTNINNNNNLNKRKISLSGPTLNAAEVMATRKNCIFFPISPNTNTVNSGNAKTIGTNVNNSKFNGGNISLSTTNSLNSSNGNSGGSFFVSPGQSAHRVRPKASFAFGKQLSLEQESSDPMIGASRRRRSYANLGGISGGNNSLLPLTSASAPPSPSVLQQQQQQQQLQQQNFYGSLFSSGTVGEADMVQQLDNQSASGVPYNHQMNSNTTLNTADLAADQNSLDLDLFSTAVAKAMDYDGLTLDELTTPNEMQRSQSVPLSQLQRIHSPAFNRSFQTAPYSACTSVAQTPVPHEFADSSTLFSENSCSQNSGGIGGSLNGKLAAQTTAAKLLDDEAALLANDPVAMLDNLDVAEMFQTDFLQMKFQNNLQSNATTTTCSSAGSSSGYSSSACTAFGSAALISGGSGGSGNNIIGCSGNTTSRSVPSTPLPHQQQQSPFSSYFYCGRRRLDEEAHLSPSLTTSNTTMGGKFTTTVFKYSNHGNAPTGNGNGGGGGGGSYNNNYDISRSMPTTPTATPRFRYSPIEFTREFLSNGNTIDSLISGGPNTGSLTDAGAPSEGLSAALTGLTGNNDALIDDSCGLSADVFINTTVTDAESMMAEANELLGNL